MQRTYLLLAIAGFIAPNILVAIESYETGNILLWLHPMATVSGMFANRISSAFVIDLLFAVMVFFVWSYSEAKKCEMKNVWKIWLLTLLFGMAGALPLFLYKRERTLKRKAQSLT